MRCANEMIHSEDVDGFTVQFYIQPEEDDPTGHFASGDDETDAETLRKIEDGTYLWFMVECVASKNEIELGHDYLGGCCYTSYAEFMAPDGYAPDMWTAALDDAKAILAKLCTC